jgi:endonuclease/exonuclease/phosphatase family metal-dependent hydrolase
MSETIEPRLRIATYNIHGCLGADRQCSESRIADVIAELGADVVGLQEVDRERTRSGRIDQAARIAERLGWRHHFQLAMQQPDGEYGNAIISRFPVTLSRAIELPGRAPFYCRETRAAACVTVQTDLGRVDVINTHLGLGRRERMLQAQLLTSAEWLDAGVGKSLILLGDLNSLPWARPLRLLRKNLRDVRALFPPARRLRTFPTARPMIALDHIFVNAALDPTNVYVHRSALARMASDHYPLVADLVLAPR